MKFGDAIHAIAQPIARGIDSVFGTDIEHCTGCGQRRQFFNNLGDRIYDHFWSNGKETMTEYIVVKQIAVEAESPEEAITNLSKGRTININVVERPQAQARTIPGGTPTRPPNATT